MRYFGKKSPAWFSVLKVSCMFGLIVWAGGIGEFNALIGQMATPLSSLAKSLIDKQEKFNIQPSPKTNIHQLTIGNK